MEFLADHPMYIPFILFNIWIIYKLIKEVRESNDERDDSDDGGIMMGEPELDLPPGVTLPVEPELVEHWSITHLTTKC